MIALLWLALVIPNPALTPGAVRALSLHTVCTWHWGENPRHVTLTMRKRIFAAYGILWVDHGAYRLDHLIPRSLGGADRVTNIWPQPTAESFLKDGQERQLHRAVCSGAMSLEAAQRTMRLWGRSP